MEKVTAKIFELGAKPAFPPQMALDHVAAHYLIYPGEDIIFSQQVVKLDVGVCYEGAIGDCAVTVDLSDQHQKLIEAVEAALINAEQIVKVGLPVREIGQIIDQTISSYGFQSVKNLGGHGLGPYKIHTSPTIPNYDDQSKAVIKPGMTFAIEPFATDGKGLIYEEGNPTIFAFTSWKPVRSQIARSILQKVKTFNGLPFSIHNLLDAQTSLSDVETGLAELLRFEVISGYGPLIEEKKGIVVQAENSVLVDEMGKVWVTTR
jgi:methionyl aminopeptidase